MAEKLNKKESYKVSRTFFKSKKEDWLISYSDIVTILLVFFVLMLSVSTINQEKVEMIQKSIANKILKVDYIQPFTDLKKQIDSLVKRENLEELVNVEMTPLGIKINFSSRVLFDSGSAQIRKDVLPFLRKVSSEILKNPYKRFLLEIEGHTDDKPIRTRRYPSNWELSGARATHVVRFFIRQGIPKIALKASGFSDSRPKLPNRDEKNRPIKLNRAANRRVEVYIHRYE